MLVYLLLQPLSVQSKLNNQSFKYSVCLGHSAEVLFSDVSKLLFCRLKKSYTEVNTDSLMHSECIL